MKGLKVGTARDYLVERKNVGDGIFSLWKQQAMHVHAGMGTSENKITSSQLPSEPPYLIRDTA